MAEILNLRTARKRAERAKAAKRAAENRVRHGMSKTERQRIDAEGRKAARDLDRCWLERGGEE